MASIDGPRPLWQPAISLLFCIVLVYVLAVNSVCLCEKLFKEIIHNFKYTFCLWI